MPILLPVAGFYMPLFLLTNSPSAISLPILLYFPSSLVSLSVKIKRVQANGSYGIPWIFSTDCFKCSESIR